jgi:predicted dehydrogenase
LAEPASIVLVGAGGYGAMYLSTLLDERDDSRFRLAGVVEPAPRNCTRLSDLEALGVAVYPSLGEFYATNQADLAVVSSPIHQHGRQTCLALERGSHVLCEKPPAATVQEVDRMIQVREQAGRWVAVGYQWSYVAPIQELKRDIQAGRFGAVRRLKSLCLWPRDESYYRRNDWAGRRRHEDGAWILDSPVNNAMAHDLHNMLYLLGDQTERSAQPVEVVAELYRANEIENFDSAALRVRTETGAELCFYGSHAVAHEMGPVFDFEFERATIEYAGGQSDIVARFDDGSVTRYASPESQPHFTKLWTCFACVSSGGRPPCGLEAARPHTLCVNGAQDSCGEITVFPPPLVHVTGSAPRRLVWVEGLAEDLRQCYTAGVLPSELGMGWSRPAGKIDLRDYRHFPGGAAG